MGIGHWALGIKGVLNFPITLPHQTYLTKFSRWNFTRVKYTPSASRSPVLLMAHTRISGLVKGPRGKGLTDSGFEMTFGVCHMGHFLLTNLLLDTLKQSAPARIVVVSSKMHKGPKRFNFAAVKSPTKSWNGVPEYGQAKLANVLFVKALAKRLEGTGVNVYALHPGVVASDVWRALPWPLDKLIKPFMLSTAEGAKTSLYCAMSDAAAGQSGLYYDECKVAEPSALALDEGLAEELWSKSEGWVEAASR